MIKKLSTKITRVFIENSIIQNEEKETYEYCFEIAIVSLISYSVLISTAIIFEEIICSCIFLFVRGKPVSRAIVCLEGFVEDIMLVLI